MDSQSAPQKRGLPRDLLVVTLSLFTWGIGEGMFIYFQPLALKRWVDDPRELGALLGAAGLAMIVAQIPAGLISDRIGARPVMWAAWIIGLLATLVMAAASTLGVFVAGMLLYSFTSFVSAPLNSYISGVRQGWTVQRAVSFVFASMYLGGVAGPLIGGWIGDSFGLPSVFRIAAVIFVVSTAMIFYARKPAQDSQYQPRHNPLGRWSIVHLTGPLRDPRFSRLMGLFFLGVFALYLPQPLTPVYLTTNHHLSIQQVGLTGTMASLGNALIMYALGGLRAPAGMATGLGLGAAFCLFLLLGQSAAIFAIGYLFVSGQRLFRSMVVGSAASLARPGETGLAFGLMETISALVVFTAPAAAGFLYNYHPQAVYITSLVGIVIVLILNILQSPGKDRPARETAQAG